MSKREQQFTRLTNLPPEVIRETLMFFWGYVEQAERDGEVLASRALDAVSDRFCAVPKERIESGFDEEGKRFEAIIGLIEVGGGIVADLRTKLEAVTKERDELKDSLARCKWAAQVADNANNEAGRLRDQNAALMDVARAATALCEKILERGSHDNWKGVYNCLLKLKDAGVEL